MAERWLIVLADAAVQSSMTDAAERFVRDGCVGDHRNTAGELDDVELCDCAANRVNPIEFVQWAIKESQQVVPPVGEKRKYSIPAGKPAGKRKKAA